MENREKSYHKIVKVKQIHWTIVLVLFLLFGNSLSASILQINVQSQLLTVNVNEESIKTYSQSSKTTANMYSSTPRISTSTGK